MPTKALLRRKLTRRGTFERLESRLFLSATRATQAVNDFGMDLYEQLQQAEGNLFFSPLSVATALAMTYAGAAGETAAEMEDVLQLGAEPGIHESFAALISSLTHPTASVADGFQLELANAIWPKTGFPIRDDFIHTIETDYQGATQSLDYSDLEQDRQIINSWVEDKTHGRIKDVLQYLSPLTVMVLANSIYFKADWTTAFDPDLTDPAGQFLLANGEAVHVPMMYTPMELPAYTSLDGFQVLEMPLEGGRTSMVFALPQDPAIPNQLTPELLVQINDWLESPRDPLAMEVMLPKFNTTVGAQLEKLLPEMGMPLAFDPGSADFSNMTPRQVFISQVRHKAFFEMNEQGTEASAATVVVMEDLCFAAGTPVLTPDGEKPIEQLKAGDYVLSRDESNVEGKIEPKRVEATFQRQGELFNLHIGGRTIRTTKEHPFFVKEQGWTAGGELRAGDLLATNLGSWMEVEKVSESGEQAPVFNFRVADHHTYFVGDKTGGFAVWAHNGCGGPPRFEADHPFHFFIRDNTTTAILFMGRIDDPRQAENELERDELDAFVGDDDVRPDFTGSDADDVFYVRLHTAGTNVLVFANDTGAGTPIYSAPIATAPALSFNTLGGNDRLVVDAAYGNPVPAGGISFAGGANTAAGDRLILRNGTNQLFDRHGTTTAGAYTASGTTAGSGVVALSGRSITLTGVEPIDVSSFAHFTVTTPNANDTLTITRSGTDTVQLAGTSGTVTLPQVTLNNVSWLAVNAEANDAGGGNDSLSIDASGTVPSNAGFIEYLSGTGTNTLTVQNGSARINSWVAAGGTLDTTVATGAELISRQFHQNGLTLANGARAVIPVWASVSVLTSLSIGTGATLDINDNTVIVNYTGASPEAAIRDKIIEGRGGVGLGNGQSDGTGIISSTAAAANALYPESRSIGYGNNGSLPLGALSTFRGQPLDATSVVFTLTVTGDANLDGRVDDNDVPITGATYGTCAGRPSRTPTWQGPT